MSVEIGTATDHANLLDLLDTFLTSQGMTLDPSFAGTGNGTIAGLIGGSASVAEMVTITFTDATHFDVVGSITGAIGSGTTGTPFSTTHIKFTITAGGTAFISGDAFTVATTPKWTSKRRTAGVEMIWQAPGNGNLDAILVGAKVFSDVAGDYYNWRLGGFTAFDAGLDFTHQPGYVGGAGQATGSPVLNLWNSTIDYWFVASGRRVIVVAKVSTVYVVAYLGFASLYMSPGVFPYPLVVGGSASFGNEPSVGSASWRWSYAGVEISNFPISHLGQVSNDSACTLRLRLPSGLWRGFLADENEPVVGRVWPYATISGGNGMLDWRPNLDGGYTILPVVLHDNTPNCYGELEGIGATTGFGQSSENTITVGPDQWLVLQNIFRTTRTDYFAVKLS